MDGTSPIWYLVLAASVSVAIWAFGTKLYDVVCRRFRSSSVCFVLHLLERDVMRRRHKREIVRRMREVAQDHRRSRGHG